MTYIPNELPELRYAHDQGDVLPVSIMAYKHNLAQDDGTIILAPYEPSLPSVSDTITIESTDPDDLVGTGDGLRMVKLIYLDSAFERQEAIVGLNGTTPVEKDITDTITLAGRRIESVDPVKVGAYKGTNQGDLVIKHKTSGAILAKCPAGMGGSMYQACTSSPDGHTRYIAQASAYVNLEDADYLDLRFWVSLDAPDADTASGGHGAARCTFPVRIKGNERIIDLTQTLKRFGPIPPCSDFWVTAYVKNAPLATASADISVFVEMFDTESASH